MWTTTHQAGSSTLSIDTMQINLSSRQVADMMRPAISAVLPKIVALDSAGHDLPDSWMAVNGDRMGNEVQAIRLQTSIHCDLLPEPPMGRPTEDLPPSWQPGDVRDDPCSGTSA